jgi:hypothetical protein
MKETQVPRDLFRQLPASHAVTEASEEKADTPMAALALL